MQLVIENLKTCLMQHIEIMLIEKGLENRFFSDNSLGIFDGIVVMMKYYKLYAAFSDLEISLKGLARMVSFC